MKYVGNKVFKEKLNTDLLQMNGILTFEEETTIKNLKVNGNAKFIKRSNIDNFKLTGNLDSLDYLICSNYNGFGKLTGKKIDCIKFNHQGNLKIKEINSDDFNFIISSNSNIETIKSKNVTISLKDKRENLNLVARKIDKTDLMKLEVMKDASKLLNCYNSRKQKLVVDVIEGENIYLENTVARLVRGKNIIVGHNCKIEDIEYI
ncbi:MAG: hypothetical protein N4A54_01750 [Peptostreptococcaceae bacterium]|jgi:cytoskeletal protein CcmA (bactofilin family)|nr:hypothetical protein [Peptostreptococcaceae bacterium]